MKYLGLVFILCTYVGALLLTNAEYANAQGVKKIGHTLFIIGTVLITLSLIGSIISIFVYFL